MPDSPSADRSEAQLRVVACSHEIRLSRAEQKRFAEALSSPPPVAPALQKAMQSRARLLDQS